MNEKIISKLRHQTSLIDKLEKIVFKGRVDWVSLEAIPINTEVDINGTKNTKIYAEENIIIFKTEIPEYFDMHYHPFNEDIILLSGSCSDDLQTYKEGESINYKPFEWHHIKKIGDKKLVLLVTFTRREKK